MRCVLPVLLLLCIPGVVAEQQFLAFSQYDQQIFGMETGSTVNVLFKCIGNLTSTPATFVMKANDGNRSLTFDGTIGNYTDGFILHNDTWKELKINIGVFLPGRYNITWKLNASTVASDSFTIIVNGTAKNVTGNNGTETRRRQRYGSEADYGAQLEFVKKWVANKTALNKSVIVQPIVNATVKNTTNTTKTNTNTNTSNTSTTKTIQKNVTVQKVVPSVQPPSQKINVSNTTNVELQNGKDASGGRLLTILIMSFSFAFALLFTALLVLMRGEP
jgi:hypothetical protein